MAYTTINKSTDYFNTKLYTGTGSSNSISGVNFQPDWVWIKKRNAAVGHRIYDSVRGVQNTLFSDSDAAEGTGQSTTLTAFNSDGFTVISESGVNASSDTYASWNWKANGAGSSNTDGSITSTVSANTTSGFSIVSFTGNGTAGATVGHGLGVAPNFIIVKSRTEVRSWVVGNSKSGWTKFLTLESTDADSTASTIWNDTAPTSSVFSIGTSAALNGSGQNIIAYCFNEVKGFSKFGSYTGNGASDTNGAFIYLGFKPSMLLVKRTNGAKDWKIFDNKRNGYNGSNEVLEPNNSDAEDTTEFVDFLSNGFKWRIPNTDPKYADVNGDGDTFIYAAFASEPFTTSTGIPCTAR